MNFSGKTELLGNTDSSTDYFCSKTELITNDTDSVHTELILTESEKSEPASSFITAYCSDPGLLKHLNQDSICIKTAIQGEHEHLIACVCDGLGGIAGGEKASGYTVSRLSGWFENSYPLLLDENKSITEIRKYLDEFLHETAARINRYGKRTGHAPGTTMTMMLYSGKHDKIIIAHTGDTRIYKTDISGTEIITADHSVLYEEIQNGILTEEEAEKDPRQNQLTRCLGAGLENSSFDYSIIPAEYDKTYLICSDGLRKKITKSEIAAALSPEIINSSGSADEALKNLTGLCLGRDETDNISSVLIRFTERTDT